MLRGYRHVVDRNYYRIEDRVLLNRTTADIIEDRLQRVVSLTDVRGLDPGLIQELLELSF